MTAHHRPFIPVVRQVYIPRPPNSSRADLPAVKGLLFYNGPEEELANVTELVVDFPGGGFIAMGPECHEERLRRWAIRTGKPVLGVKYGKAPECTYTYCDSAQTHAIDPYPYAIEEGFDA